VELIKTVKWLSERDECASVDSGCLANADTV
jgi:hypothetical protein